MTYAQRIEIVDAISSEVLTEENTDQFIDILMIRLDPRLPWWVPGGLIRKVLDALLPGVLTDALRELVDRIS